LLLFYLLPLFIIFLPLLLFDLLLEHPLQVLLLVLLPLIYMLWYLHEPVHRPRYGCPRVLEGLLE
jgi:positive regulator of sigma E activity